MSWTLYLVDYLPLFHLFLFLETSPVLSFGTCFFVSFWLLPCVYFHVLDRAVMFPGLGRVAFCSRCRVGPRGAASLITWGWCSRCAPVRAVCTVLLQLSLDCYWHVMGGNDQGWLAVRTGYNYSGGVAVQGPTPWSRSHSSESLVLAFCLLSMCRGGWVIIQCGLKLSTGCTAPRAFQEMQGQPLPMSCPGPPVIRYRAICRKLLLVLGLEVLRKAKL